MSATEVLRAICADGTYQLKIEEGHIVLIIADEDDRGIGVMTPEQGETFLADFARLLAAIKGAGQ